MALALDPISTSVRIASSTATVLFAGGGTGGHILPNVAIAERLFGEDPKLNAHYLLSSRAIDENVAARYGLDFTPSSSRPWSGRPWHWPAFAVGLMDGTAEVGELIGLLNVKAVIATGGFVSGPALLAARRYGVSVATVNLDAVPGRANRHLARQADKVFTVYPHASLPGAEPIGMPLRRAAVGPKDHMQARQSLDLDPSRHTLFVTGGSQGASSLNNAVIELLARPTVREALVGWQVLHLAGTEKLEDVREAYDALGVDATVVGFLDRMGLAWRAATVAISRAGAGSVAEAWTNGTPTAFLPYPHHKDEHQRHNTEPLLNLDAARLVKDRVDARATANALEKPLIELACDMWLRRTIRQTLAANQPADGADAVSAWAMDQLNRASSEK